MAHFVEVTPQNGNSKILINSASIQSVVTDLNSKTLIYFLNTVRLTNEYLMIKESYDEIKKQLLQ